MQSVARRGRRGRRKGGPGRGRKKVIVPEVKEDPLMGTFGFETELEESPVKKSPKKSISEMDLHKLYRMEGPEDSDILILSSAEPTPRKRGLSLANYYNIILRSEKSPFSCQI